MGRGKTIKLSLYIAVPLAFLSLFFITYYSLSSVKKIVLESTLSSIEERRSFIEHLAEDKICALRKSVSLVFSSGLVESYESVKGKRGIALEKVLSLISLKLLSISKAISLVEEIAIFDGTALVASSLGLKSVLSDTKFVKSGFFVFRVQKVPYLAYALSKGTIHVVSCVKIASIIPKGVLGLDLVVIEGPDGVLYRYSAGGPYVERTFPLISGLLSAKIGYSKKVVFAPVVKIKKVILFSSLLLAFLLAVFSYLLFRFIVIPLETFTEYMEKVSGGDFDARLPDLPGDWRIMGRAMENMVRRIRELMEDVRKKEEQLFQAQKLESLGTLAGGIAHEFNNILASSMGYLELLSMSKNLPEKEKNLVNKALKSLQRGMNLTSQVLSFARKAPAKKEPTDISLCVKEVVELSKATFPRNIKIVYEEEGRDFVTLADANQIKQAVTNLAINARDAMREKGGGVLTFRVRREKDKVVVEVSDTGVGIPEDIKGKIFDPFFTTKPPGEGTGLGLSIVMGVVKRHGGSIEVESEEGVGTTFRIKIPVVKVEEETKKPVKIRTVLIVDDEKDFREVVKEFLKDFEVYEAGSGEEALELVKKLGDKLDLIILDMVMPDMDGAEVVKRLEEMGIKTKVLLVTGYSRKDLEEVCKSSIVIGFLTKPFTSSQLRSAIGA